METKRNDDASAKPCEPSAHSGQGAHTQDWAEPVLAALEQSLDTDVVNHPSHYTRGRFETIDVIEDWQLGFHLGNAVKYISRAGHKDPAKTVEDLKKARWYLDRYIAQLESGGRR